MSELIPEDMKKKPGIRHLRAVGLVICKQIQMSKDAAKKGASFKEATAVRVNDDPEFMEKIKAVWNGKD